MKRSVFAVVCALSLGASAWAHQPASEPPAGQSMVVGIDARTGQLRQLSDAEISELSSKAQNEAASLARTTRAAQAGVPLTGAEAEKTLRVLPNGLSVASLPLSAMHSMTAQLDADGKVVISEADHGHGPAATEVSE